MKVGWDDDIPNINMESHKNLSVPKHQHQPVIYINSINQLYIYIYQHHQPVVYIYLLMDSSPNHLRIMWTSTERPTGPRNGPTHRLWCRDVEKSCREVLRALNEGCVTRIHLPRPQKKGPKNREIHGNSHVFSLLFQWLSLFFAGKSMEFTCF